LLITSGLSPTDHRRAGGGLGSEAGVTLVELIITVAIVGVAITAILLGMITSIKASALHRKEATADTVLRDAAEAVVDPQQIYQNCASLGSYSLTSVPFPSGYSVSVTAIQFWKKDNPATFSSTCPNPDPGLQLVTIVARSADGQATETLTVAKRKG
jgi:prepilin-type N-terminal cleavage/methylation domain-containing protein